MDLSQLEKETTRNSSPDCAEQFNKFCGTNHPVLRISVQQIQKFLRIRKMENAELYSSSNSLQRSDAVRVIQEVLPFLPDLAGARVIDIGCGSGDVTAQLLLPLLPQDVDQLVGIDLSQVMISHARAVYTDPKLAFARVDIENEHTDVFQTVSQRLVSENNNIKVDKKVEIMLNGLQIKEEDEEEEKSAVMRFCCEETMFDVAFSFYCLHWIQDQRQAFKNISALLKSNGHAILVLLAQSAIFTLYEKMAELPKWTPYMKDFAKFISPYHHCEDPARNISDLAESLDFDILRVDCRKRTYMYQDYSSMKDAIKAVSPFLPRLDPTDAEEFLDDCLDVIVTNNLAEELEDGVLVKYSLLVVHLKKRKIPQD